MVRKVLVVDDNPFICQLIESRLRANEYEVSIALNGEEAIEKVKTILPDLILLDISMPGVDGIEVGRAVRANPVTHTIPIIMVTARGEHQVILKAVSEIGAAGYIIKPFKPEVLLREMAKVLDVEEA